MVPHHLKCVPSLLCESGTFNCTTSLNANRIEVLTFSERSYNRLSDTDNASTVKS